MGNAVRIGSQPALLVLALVFWSAFPDAPWAPGVGIVAVQLVLGILEMRTPARPEWKVGARERGVQIVAFAILGAVAAVLGDLYREIAAGPFARARAEGGLDIWPHAWPPVAQVLLVFFGSEFVWYWIHRAEHRWAIVWRVSGHGAHHSFKRLGALNSGLNHPFELFLLLLPAATIELVFGVGSPVVGAALLVLTQASLAHSNLDLNSTGIGWLFTTNRHHIHHHSVVLEESNTNYGCAAIVWDRLFGTFADAATAETGTGPTEPGWWGKFVMPFREPTDTATAPPSRP